MTARALVIQYFQHLRRDHTGVMFLVVFPAMMMALLGNIYAGSSGAPKIAVSGPRASAERALLLDRLSQPGRLNVVPVASRPELDDLVRRGRVEAGLVLPKSPGFDHGTIELVGPPDVEAPVGVRREVESALAETVAVLKVEAANSATRVEAEQALGLDHGGPAVAFELRSRRSAAIATLILVTFTNLIAIGSLIPAHRRLDVIPRLRAAGMTDAALVRAYYAIFVAAAGVQVAVALSIGSVLLDVSWGAAPVVAVAATGLAVAAGAAGVLAGTLLPSPESGSSVGGPVGFVLGMLGGCLWPLSIVSRPLQIIGHATPQAWLVDAFDTVADPSAPLTALVAPSVAVAGFAMAILLAGSARLVRSWR